MTTFAGIFCCLPFAKGAVHAIQHSVSTVLQWSLLHGLLCAWADSALLLHSTPDRGLQRCGWKSFTERDSQSAKSAAWDCCYVGCSREWIVCLRWGFGFRIASRASLVLYAGIALMQTYPRELKSYWKPVRLRCKILVGLLQSEKPESRWSLGGLQCTAAGCSLLEQTRLLW